MSKWHTCGPLGCAACCEEIRALRARVAELEGQLKFSEQQNEIRFQSELRAGAEVVRLEAQVKTLTDERDAARAEIERLRKLNTTRFNDNLATRRDADRLREALTESHELLRMMAPLTTDPRLRAACALIESALANTSEPEPECPGCLNERSLDTVSGSIPCPACRPAKPSEPAPCASCVRLREALTGLHEYERKRHPPKMGGDHYPPSLRSLMLAADVALAAASEEPRKPQCCTDSEANRAQYAANADVGARMDADGTEPRPFPIACSHGVSWAHGCAECPREEKR